MCDTKQIQESQRTPSRIYSKITIPRHIIFKLQKPKDKKKKIVKEVMVWAWHLTYRRAKGRIKCNLPSKITRSRGEWTEIFAVLSERKHTPT